VTSSVVTETTEGITLVTTGRKSGKGVLGSLSDGNVQSKSVCWPELSDWVGSGVAEQDRTQIPVLNVNVTSITTARMRLLDISHRVNYSIVTFTTKNLCPNSRDGMANDLTTADLTIRNATFYNEGNLGLLRLLGSTYRIWLSLDSCSKQ
jgi:hypothetical protein